MSQSEVQGRLLVGSDGWRGGMSADPWEEWKPEPDEEEEGVGGWTPPDVEEEED